MPLTHRLARRRFRARPRIDPRTESAIERRLSVARLLLAGLSLVSIVGEHGLDVAPGGTILLAAFTGYSVVLAIVLRLSRLRAAVLPIRLFHVVDFAWTTAVFSAQWGVGGPFVGFYLFVLLAAGFRWGTIEVVITGVCGMVAIAADARLRSWLGTYVDWHVAGIDFVYLLVVALLVGLGEDERRRREQTWAASEILGRIGPRHGLVGSVQNVLGSLMRQLGASRAVLTIAQDDLDHVHVWTAQVRDAPERAEMRLRQHPRDNCRTWLFPVPDGADAWQAVAHRTDGRRPVRVRTLDVSGERSTRTVDSSPLLEAPFRWQEALCLTSLAGDGWQARLFLFDPSWRPGTYNLRFLQSVVHRIVPALLNLQLQRRLASRSGVLERAEISRQLHDGVIQSLIGIEMQVDVIRREAAGGASASAGDLDAIQQVLAGEILNLRDLMRALKPGDVEPDRLVEHLAGEIAHFRSRTRIDARLVCAEDDIDLSPRVCREVAGVVCEALANVRKHAGASSVLVRLGRLDDNWLLTIDDNGCGFGFEATMDQAELETRHAAPVIVVERVRAIGGRLSITSRPGTGARLDILIPGRHHAR